MISLSSDALIGSGNTRSCYYHPGDARKCIKILKDTARTDVNKLELGYYNHLNRHRASLTHLPKCYGYVDTNLGPGLVFDVVEDNDGTLANTLKKMVKQGSLSINEAQKLVEDLERYLRKSAIAFCDDSLDNLVVVDNRLYIIDGMVSNKPLKTLFYCYIPLLRAWRTRKSMKNVNRRLKQLVA